MNSAVLIVDDSLTVRMDLSEAFTEAGFRTIPCATASAAREAFAREALGIVILDVILPDGDGVELLEELRARADGKDMVILMLSTESEVKDRIRGLATGADEYVGKPYDTSYVVGKARELLLSRSAKRSEGEPARVLVIDDSLFFREMLREALQKAGYEVLVAASGEEGLRTAATHRPSALVVDGNLPGIDGWAVIRHVRLDAALRGSACVLLTGEDGTSAELSALEAGADAFVRKGEDLDVILARLAAAIRAAGSPAAVGASLLGPKRILVVDTDEAYLTRVGEALRVEGYDVVSARSGQEALDLLAVQPVDCVLVEALLPGLDGNDVCRRIKEAPGLQTIPLIVQTSADRRDSMLESLGAGADDCLVKSSDTEVLKARVRAQLRRKQFEDEHRRIREQLLRKELEATEARAAKELAETRAALVEELESKNEELEAFSFSVSHDLRAPLRSIDGFSAALLEDCGDQLDATGKEHIRRVRAAAQRMGELIEDLLEFSRVGRAELRKTATDVTALAQMVIGTLARNHEGRHVETRIDENMGAFGDPRLLMVVLENLLNNAWKFSSKEVAARVEVMHAKEGDFDVFRVRDNGAGFDMAYAKKLFVPFQRLHSTSEFPGTGIGLATIRRIVERHGGRVSAEGALGEGATITFTLPQKKDS